MSTFYTLVAPKCMSHSIPSDTKQARGRLGEKPPLMFKGDATSAKVTLRSGEPSLQSDDPVQDSLFCPVLGTSCIAGGFFTS